MTRDGAAPRTIKLPKSEAHAQPLVDTLELNEPANDLDRSGGQAFVLNRVP